MDAKKGLWIIGGVAVAITGAIGAGLYYSFRRPGLGNIFDNRNEAIAFHNRNEAINHCIGVANKRWGPLPRFGNYISGSHGPVYRRFVDECLGQHNQKKLSLIEGQALGIRGK